MFTRIRVIVVGVLAVLMVAFAVAGNVAGVQAQAGTDDGIGKPLFTEIRFGGSVSHTANTVPYWSNSFTFGGVTYPYIMVGTNPATGGSSTIPTEIIPLSFTLSTGQTLDGSSKLNLTVASPIFQNAGFSSGMTQFGDAMVRAQWWKTGGSSAGYHVLLGQPTILSTEHINVPQNQGVFVRGRRTGAPIGLIDINWFSAQLTQLLGQRHISSTTMPIFLTYNIFLYIGDNLSNCCVLGYHGAQNGVARGGSQNGNGSQQIQTFIFASYSDPGIFGASVIQDINGLSHEVAEWLSDPFTNNIVPNWSVAGEPQYGCSNILEEGDPLVGVGYNLTLNGTTYHPQDIPFFSWFAHEPSPTRAINGVWDYAGVFTTPATLC